MLPSFQGLAAHPLKEYSTFSTVKKDIRSDS